MADSTPLDATVDAAIRRGFGAQAFMDTLGATLERVEPGLIEIHAPHDAKLTQQGGTLLAGASTALVDSARGFAALTLAPHAAPVKIVIKLMSRDSARSASPGARWCACCVRWCPSRAACSAARGDDGTIDRR